MVAVLTQAPSYEAPHAAHGEGFSGMPLRAAVCGLTLTDFRNYASARLTLDGRPVVLTGGNGAGKTNVLEAVSFLAPGRGLHRARLSEVTRIGAASGAWAVSATLVSAPSDNAHRSRPETAPRQSLPVKIGTGLVAGEHGAVNERRVVRIDGVVQSSATSLAQLLSVVWLTPEMDRLFSNAASERRRFFDRLAYGFDPGHGTRVNAYERALRERSRLLRDDSEPRGKGADPAWLDALEAVMAEHGVAIAAARCETLARLDNALIAADGLFPRPTLALNGLLEGWLAQIAAVDAEDRFCRLLAQTRARDAAAGRALDGPHRSDIMVWHGETGYPAAQCSTGQQKALLIAIVLGYARALHGLGVAPILLLDEVVAHLDLRARGALFNAIEALGAQAWLTGADAAMFAEMGCRAQYFTAAGGWIRQTDAS